MDNTPNHPSHSKQSQVTFQTALYNTAISSFNTPIKDWGGALRLFLPASQTRFHLLLALFSSKLHKSQGDSGGLKDL